MSTVGRALTIAERGIRTAKDICNFSTALAEDELLGLVSDRAGVACLRLAKRALSELKESGSVSAETAEAILHKLKAPPGLKKSKDK
jgi:hypothetical protein